MAGDPDSVEGTLLVPIANRETASRQLDTAIQLARDRSYRILLVYVLAVPPQLSLQDGRRYLLEDEHEELLEWAETRVENAGVPADKRLRIARGVGRSIVKLAAEKNTDAVLLGWRGRPPRQNVVLGSYVDTVLRNAPCDVLVKRIQTPTPEVESVLVPVSDGPHSEYAVETAASIARSNDAAVHLLHVHGEESDLSRASAKELLEDQLTALEGVSSVDRELVSSSNVAGTITDATVDHDVTVLGVSRGSLLQRTLLGSISNSVGRHAAGTVILARRYDPVPSRLRRLLSPL